MNAPGNPFSSAAGLFVDLVRLATCRLQNPHSYLKYLAINRLRRATAGRTFIETGTYLGGTAYRCSKVFDRVYTIELDPELARQAAENLSQRPNVEVIQGDAAIELESVFTGRVVDRAVVFLDGHYSGGTTACGAAAEPALQELEVLGKHSDAIQAIVIDDFRNFGVEPGHPAKSELLRTLETHFPESLFSIAVQNDQVLVARRP
jgi:hypothetical protein